MNGKDIIGGLTAFAVLLALCLLAILLARNCQDQGRQEEPINVEVQEVRYAEDQYKCYLTRVAGRSVLICPYATATVLDEVKIKEDEGP